MVLAREAAGRDQAQRPQQAAWDEALAGCGLPLAGLDSPRARPRFAQAAPLPAAIPGEAELLDIWLTERLPRWRVRDAVESTLPPGNRLVDLHDVWLGEAPLPGQVIASVYRADLAGDVDVSAVWEAVTATLAAASLVRERQKGAATVTYDLRPFIDELEVAATGEETPARFVVRMRLRHDPEKGVGRPDELLAALGDAIGAPLPVSSLVRERLVLAVAPPAEDAPRGRSLRARSSAGRPPAAAPKPRSA
jgi:hypothetical protein